MKKVFLIFIFLILYSNAAGARHLYSEKYYQSEWCGKWHGKQEYKLKDNTRVDCLTANYAVEFDFAPKWAESIGQALYYGKMTGKRPAVILIIENPSDWKYYHRLNKISHDYNVTVWYMKSPEYSSKTPSKTDNLNNTVKTVYTYFQDFLK